MSLPSSSSDEAMYYAIVPAADRRGADRRATGAPATATRIVAGQASRLFDVIVTDVSSRGVGLRSPVPLETDAVYRIVTLSQQVGYIRIVRSRPRPDGAYDVGALHADVAGGSRLRTAA